MEERLHAPTVYLSGGTSTTNSDRHVVRLKFKCPVHSSTSTDSTGTWYSGDYVRGLAIASGEGEFGSDSTLPTTGTETITLPDTTTVNVLSTYGFSATGTAVDWIGWLQRGTTATSALSSGNITFYYLYTTYSYHVLFSNGTTDQSTSSTAWNKVTLTLDKLALEGISTDSRRVYGKANIDGELPGDPNADLTTNNFQPWIFHGGHFVGNMPYSSSKDQSGTARTQLRLQTMTDADTYIAACVTCFASGTRGDKSPGTIGLFRPQYSDYGGSNDTNLNVGLSTIWDTKWNISPGGTQSGPGDFTKAPYYTYTPNTTNDGSAGADQFNYINWQLPAVPYVWQTAYGGDGTVGHNKMWKYFALCPTDETSSTTCWQYFGSTWIEGVTGQTFPLTDSKPRVWKLRSAS